jgi:hypothetical protein
MKHSLLIACIIISSLLICGCTSSNSNTSKDNYSGKYIVIDEVKQVAAKVIDVRPNNSTPFPMFMNDATPYPVYPDQPGKYGVTVNSSLSILCFNYYSLYGPFRNITSVRGIYNFPYQLESGVTILGIDQNGTIKMCYSNETFNLDNGTFWSSPIVSSSIGNSTGYNGSLVKLEYDTNWWIYYEPSSYKV